MMLQNRSTKIIYHKQSAIAEIKVHFTRTTFIVQYIHVYCKILQTLSIIAKFVYLQLSHGRKLKQLRFILRKS